MNLYLMRHAESEDGPREDPTRQLTSIGRKQAVTMGEFLVRQVGRVDMVLTSYFARARATAAPIAELLGCQTIIDTGMLEPNADVDDAWKEIQFIAGEVDEVLVVTHHPLTNELLKKLTGCDAEEFKHASVVHIKDGKLHWFVPPHVVERDEDELLESAIAVTQGLAAHLEEAKKPATGLLHPRHQKVLKPAVAKLKKLFAGYFKDQGEAVMKEVRPHIQRTIAQFAEASGTGKRFADTLIPTSIHPLKFATTAGQSDKFNAAITDAITGAGKVLAKEMESGTTIGEDVAGGYLRENSLEKLTGGFADTSIERLRNAVADAWDAGGSFAQVTSAIQDTFADFSDSRAEMIAQTEANDAYNAGRMAMADQLEVDEKAWETESGDPCEDCLGNEAQGFIAMDEDFESGDDAPTAHPRCMCTLIFRATSGPEE